jgi:AhpC/TSA family
MPRQGLNRIGLPVVVLGLGLLVTPPLARALDVGDKAPDFLMHSTVDETIRLSDYQGKKHVMVFFFVAAFTGA